MSAASVRRALGAYHPRRIAYKGAVWGRLCAERWALAAWERAAGGPSPARRGRILAYHSIGTPGYGVNDARPRDFERHLQIAVDDGWSFTTPAEVIAEPDKPQLALTFDDGMASVLANALPVLRHHGIPATAFVVTGWADGQIPDSVKRIVLDWRGVSALQDGGMTLASHSVSHSDFGRLEPGEARRELEVSRDRMRQVLGVETSEFAIPLGQSRNWTREAGLAAAEAGLHDGIRAMRQHTSRGNDRAHVHHEDRPAGAVPSGAGRRLRQLGRVVLICVQPVPPSHAPRSAMGRGTRSSRRCHSRVADCGHIRGPRRFGSDRVGTRIRFLRSWPRDRRQLAADGALVRSGDSHGPEPGCYRAVRNGSAVGSSMAPTANI